MLELWSKRSQDSIPSLPSNCMLTSELWDDALTAKKPGRQTEEIIGAFVREERERVADRHLAMHKTESGHRGTRENVGGLLSISCNLQLKCSLMTSSS